MRDAARRHLFQRRDEVSSHFPTVLTFSFEPEAHQPRAEVLSFVSRQKKEHLQPLLAQQKKMNKRNRPRHCQSHCLAVTPSLQVAPIGAYHYWGYDILQTGRPYGTRLRRLARDRGRRHNPQFSRHRERRASVAWRSPSLWSRSCCRELRHGVRSHDVHGMVDRLDEDGEGAKVAALSKNLRQTVIVHKVLQTRPPEGLLSKNLK